MTAIVKNPGETAELFDLDTDSLKSLQEAVGGYVTTVFDPKMDGAGITIWANDEGLLHRLDPNLLVHGQPIVGPVVFTGHDDEGNTIALTEDQVLRVRAFLAKTTLDERGAMIVALRLQEMF